jgi:hypothetical protein
MKLIEIGWLDVDKKIFPNVSTNKNGFLYCGSI